MIDKIKKIINNHFTLTAFIVFFVVIFSLYGKSLFFNWTYYDDDVLILDKQEYLSFSNIKRIFSNTIFGQGKDKFCRPVLNLTFLVEKYIYGIKPFGYHLTNLIIHLFAVFSIFLFLTLRYDKKKTLLLCLLFACHPAIVQAVAWIPGRNDSLLTLFIILSCYYLIRYIDTKKYLYCFIHLLFFILALLTKETSVIIPVFYFIFLYLKSKNIKKIVIFATIWSIIIIAYLFYRSFVLSGHEYSLTFHELIKNFIVSFPALAKYIANIFFPLKLSVFQTILEINYLLSIASILVFVLLFIKFKTYNKIFIYLGFSWFILFLFPTFLMSNNQFYDHRIYLPLVGILIVILELIENSAKIHYKKIFLAVFLVFISISFFNEQKFKDKYVFWINAFLMSPQSDIANAMVAGLFFEQGLYEEAEKKYLKAIELRQYSKHYVNLAALYFRMKRLDDAEQCLLKALTLDNYNPTTYYNLALVYKYKGDKARAQEMKNWYIKVFNDTNKVSKIDELTI